MNIPIPPSILKKTSAYTGPASIPILAPNKEPPGVPPYPPPEFSSDDEDSQDKVSSLLFVYKELCPVAYGNWAPREQQ